MDPSLNIPVGRSRKRAMMLPILLGLVVLLYVLVLMPVAGEKPTPDAPAAQTE